MYLLDTPGVLPPKIESVETGMKLALCGEWINIMNHRFEVCFWFFTLCAGTILDHLVGEDVIADYLLYCLNRQEKLRCVGPPPLTEQTVISSVYSYRLRLL